MSKRFAIMLTMALCAGLAHAAPKKHAAPPTPPPQEITGTVSRIVDGDTLWVKPAAEDAPVVVRIDGIDAPETCQPGGKEATVALAELALNRTVTVRPVATDDFGRKVGKVFDGTRDIGDRMVRDGHAWSTRYKYDRGPYVAEERMAQALKRGLHAETGAIHPREFRQRNGPCPSGGNAAPSRLSPTSDASARRVAELQPTAALGPGPAPSRVTP